MIRLRKFSRNNLFPLQKLKCLRPLHVSSRLIHYPLTTNDDEDKHSFVMIKPSSPPIYQTATFQQSSPTAFDAYDYSRSGNPTRDELQRALAALEVTNLDQKVSAFAFNSGMAAIATVFQAVGPNVPVIAGSDLYGGTLRLLEKVVSSESRSVTYVDMTDLEEVKKALQKLHSVDNGKEPSALVWCESPSNPTMNITDLREVAALCRSYGALLCIDNTMMSPLFQRPLEVGADIVVHSATKFLNGHGDVTGGVATTVNEKICSQISFLQNANGNALAPFDAWLLLRGLKTLSVRMERQQDNALRLYHFLCETFGEQKVYYAGFGDQGNIHRSQSTGTGSVLSFSTGDSDISIKLLKNLKLFKTQVSFGSVTSSIELPWYHSHASIPDHLKAKAHFNEDLIRISLGIENYDDLESDFKNALHKVSLKQSRWNNQKLCSNSTQSTQRATFSTSSKFSQADACGDSTAAVQGGQHRKLSKFSDTLTTPIAMTSAFWFNDSQELLDFATGKFTSFEYGRYGNPTTQTLENKLIAVEGVSLPEFSALATASGMSVTTTMLMALVPKGGHVVTTKDCYRRTRQFISKFLPKMGITHDVIENPGDANLLRDLLKTKKAHLFFSESPTNPFLRCVNIPEIAEICRSNGTIFCIDSTFATPVNQKPLLMGADLVLHSATKYLAGHNDVLAGVIIGRSELIKEIQALHNVLGAVIDPFASYLVLRGMKTLKLRVDQQNKTALKLAEYLEAHPMIEKVHYPGLPSHPDHSFAKVNMKGFGGVVSFQVRGDLHWTSRFIDGLKLPFIAPSLGGVESLVEQPTIISYWDQTPSERSRIGIADNLVRFSCGIEDTDDIIRDVEQSLTTLSSCSRDEPYLKIS